MSRLEYVELLLVALIAATGVWWTELLPESTTLGRVLMTGSAILLAQGLVRDLVLLMRARRRPGQPEPKQARCMCMESSVGAAGILAGAILLFGVFDIAVVMTALHWQVIVTTILILGFIMKDWVILMNPFRITRDPDHVNIIVRWKS